MITQDNFRDELRAFLQRNRQIKTIHVAVGTGLSDSCIRKWLRKGKAIRIQTNNLKALKEWMKKEGK